MKVGLIGFGMVAERFHAPLIAGEPGLELTHVVERHRSRSVELYPDVQVLRSAEALLQTDVELVVVLTPNQSHFELARQALAAGKHVVIDKPMTATSEQADRLIRFAEERGLVLSVFHNRRWDSDFLTLAKLLQDETLGDLVSLESRFDRHRPFLKGNWREEPGPGAGVLYDLGSHLLDQSFQLFGKPKALLADLHRERAAAEVTDGFLLLLDYGALKVELRSSCMAAEPPLRFRARGTRGAWLKTGLDPQEEALRLRQRPGGPEWGRVSPEQWGRLYLAGADGVVPTEGQAHEDQPGDYPRFYAGLAQALRSASPPPVLPGEARDVLRALELAEESHARRGWVEWS